MDYEWIFEKCFEAESEIVAWRRKLHTLAETGFNTQKTQGFIKAKLLEMGLFPHDLGGGIVCEIQGKAAHSFSPCNIIDEKRNTKVTHYYKKIPKKEKCVLLRADIDALPLCETAKCEFTAQNGNMHACGHDIHTASLLGAALVLNKHRNTFRGTVKLVFQSAEEILSGAEKMIKNGVLKSPSVDFCAALHVVVGTDFETGSAIVPSDGMNAPYADFFKITVNGKSGHGATPQASKNAALCGAAITLELEQHAKSDNAENFSLSVCKIHSGKAPNVIPEKCEIEGTLRALSENARKKALSEIRKICMLTAELHGCSAELSITSGTTALFCDSKLTKSAEECLKTSYSSHLNATGARIVRAPTARIKPGTPSEDFAEFAKRAPSVLIGLCTGKASDGFIYPLHNPNVIFDERALAYGTAIYTTLALGFLNESTDNSPRSHSQ